MLAANVIGFVGTDDKGLDGIEQQFDGMIKGEEQTSSIFTDALARPIMDSVFLKNSPVDANCKNIQLTINAQYQFIIEKALDKAMMDHGAESVTAIVMNPKMAISWPWHLDHHMTQIISINTILMFGKIELYQISMNQALHLNLL